MQCNQFDTNSAVFVESTILDIDTGKLFVYNPLVINKNTEPAAPIIAGILPANYVAIINIGSNGVGLNLIPSQNSTFYTYSNFKNSLEHGNCIDGFYGSIFGQVAYCNADLFFKTANQLISNKVLTVPPIPVANLGDICPTVRSFSIVDQDQSDNVNTQYLVTYDMKIAQIYQILNVNVTRTIVNPSDNRLIDSFISKAIGCTSFTAPDLVDMTMRNSLALNEIQANLLDPNNINTALVPSIDPMCLINGTESLEKTNAYRIGVNQPLLTVLNNQNNINYCNQLQNSSINFYIKHMNELQNFTSPDPNVSNNLLDFLINRYIISWNILNCKQLTGRGPILQVNFDNNGLIIANNLNSLITNTTTNFIATSFNNCYKPSQNETTISPIIPTTQSETTQTLPTTQSETTQTLPTTQSENIQTLPTTQSENTEVPQFNSGIRKTFNILLLLSAITFNLIL